LILWDFTNDYLSPAPQEEPQAAAFDLSPAPQAEPQAAFLSDAPHDVPQEDAIPFVRLFHPDKFESAIFMTS
jgi:hypothetical protein